MSAAIGGSKRQKKSIDERRRNLDGGSIIESGKFK